MDAEMNIYELIRSGILICPACQDVLQYPCILPCLHTLCGKCIDAMHEGKGKDTVVSCTECRAVHLVPERGFHCNQFLRNLLEIHSAQSNEQKQCAYCAYDQTDLQATTRCIECEDDLCQQCTAAHKKTKLTRHHTLAPFSLIQLGKYDLDIRQQQTVHCQDHTTRPCTSYCETCDSITCDQCFKHREAKHNVIAIQKVTEKGTGDTQKLCDILEERQPFYHFYKEYLNRCELSLNNEIQNAKNSVTTRAALLHRLVDQQKEDSLAKLEREVKEHLYTLKHKVERTENKAACLHTNHSYIKHLLTYAKPEESLDLANMITQRVEQITQDEEEKVVSELRVVVSDDADNLMSLIKSASSDISITTHPPNPQVLKVLNEAGFSTAKTLPQIRHEVNIVSEFSSSLTDDKHNTWPTGVAVSKEGDVIVCDRDNSRIKRFTLEGTFKHTFSGSGDYKLCKPFDVAELTSGNLVISDYGCECVLVYTFRGEGVFKIDGCEYPRGVAVTASDEILVLDSELCQVTLHSSTDGALIKIIHSTDDSKILVDPYYVCTTSDNRLIVTDFAEPNVKLLPIDEGKVEQKGEYGVTSTEEMLQPYGCCQDKYDFILIADNRNDRISMLLPDGTFQKHLMTRTNGLWQPIALCTAANGYLVITEGLGKVKVVQYM